MGVAEGKAISYRLSPTTTTDHTPPPTTTDHYHRPPPTTTYHHRPPPTTTTTTSVTAGRPPWGGVFGVAPINGTSLVDTFRFSAENWTDDAASLPLTYAFSYVLGSSASSYLSDGFSTSHNTSVSLPLGYGDRYELVVGVMVRDVIG